MTYILGYTYLTAIIKPKKFFMDDDIGDIMKKIIVILFSLTGTLLLLSNVNEYHSALFIAGLLFLTLAVLEEKQNF